MESLERDHAKMLCHECHKFVTSADSGYVSVEFLDTDTCPRCLCPESQIDRVLLLNPLYRCSCSNLILQYSSKMFECNTCRDNYCNYMLTVVDVAIRLNIEYNQVMDLDPLISYPFIECDGINHIYGMVDRSQIATYLNYFISDSNTPNCDYANSK